MSRGARTLLALLPVATMGLGFTLGFTYPREPRTVPVYQDRLVVPTSCADALRHADALTLHLGEAIGIAARDEPDDLVDLLSRAQPDVEHYKQQRRLCRQEGAQP